MSDDEFIGYQRKLVAWFLAGLISSVGVNQGIQKATTIRHDPYTGTEAREMEHRLDKIDAIQQTMMWRMNQRERDARECREELESHLRSHK